QIGAIWFTLVAALAVFFLMYIAKWYKQKLAEIKKHRNATEVNQKSKAPKKEITIALIILIFIVFARSWYENAISNYYAFYTMETYGVTFSKDQFFLFSGAVGTFLGGPLADRFGKKIVILLSLIIPAPFTLLLPFVNSVLAFILLILIGVCLMSSFSVSVVYAQELIPGKVGTMSGL